MSSPSNDGLLFLSNHTAYAFILTIPSCLEYALGVRLTFPHIGKTKGINHDEQQILDFDRRRCFPDDIKDG